MSPFDYGARARAGFSIFWSGPGADRDGRNRSDDFGSLAAEFYRSHARGNGDLPLPQLFAGAILTLRTPGDWRMSVRPDVAQLLTAGLAHHQAGRLAEAEAHYRRLLEIEPDHADAFHLLGGVAYQAGRHEMAIELIGRAIQRNPDEPSYYCSCGLVLQNVNRLEEAVASYDRALALKPDYAVALINRGLALEALERFADALDSYDRALAISPDSGEALLNRGNTLQRLGRFAEAVESYDRTLALRPDLAEAYYNRGDALQALNRRDEAASSYDRALVLNPDLARAFVVRGTALQQAGRLAEALETFDRALAVKPDDVEILIGRGNTLHLLGRSTEALASYDQALMIRPAHAETLINRGAALAQLGRSAEALDSYNRALALRPDFAPALVNRGNILERLGRFAEALDDYDRAASSQPDDAVALNNRGNILQQLCRWAEALDSYDRALALRPDYAPALMNRGNTLEQLGRLAEAEASYDRALALKPDDAAIWFNRGTVLRLLGKLDEAVASWRQATALRPDLGVAEGFNTRQMICDWSNYREDEARDRDAIKAQVSPFAPFALLGITSTAEEQLECARRVAAGLAIPAADMLPRVGVGPRPAQKIRLGYLSADFREHPTSILIAGLIERHDRGRFEVAAYSSGRDDGSAIRSRLVNAFDRFVEIRDMTSRQAAELIYGDGIDILIDLNGYTTNGRSQILAYRPAPIQVNYLAYPATMGADFIDYIIVDRFVVPPEQQSFFTEQLVYMPDSFLPNDDSREIADRTPSRRECGLPQTGVVFCCFNNTWKLSPLFFDIWMRLLTAVPDSVLWLSDLNPRATANLAREAAARGVHPERLIFAPRLNLLAEHLARHRCADLFLDTLPYNAITTASDALWAGLPLLTCAGNTFAGRVAGSLLRAVGLDELVTTSLEEYEALAMGLARDLERLSRLRRRLMQNRETYPLFDTGRYARNLETAYEQMWEGRKAGRPPAPISVL